MISTVTTSTVSTVSTVASAVLAGQVALIGILILIILLVQKELTAGSANQRFKRLSRALNIGIAPLFIAFAAMVATRVIAAFH